MSKVTKNDSTDEVKSSDFNGIAPKTAELLLAEAEKRLAIQMAFFATSDSRAVGILSAAISLGAAAVALAGFGLQGQSITLPLVVSGSVGVCLTSGSAHFALRALSPEPTKPPGWYPSEFLGDLAQRKSLAAIKADLIAHANGRLRHNKRLKEKLDSLTSRAMFLLAIAPLCALVAGVITQGFSYLPVNLQRLFS